MLIWNKYKGEHYKILIKNRISRWLLSNLLIIWDTAEDIIDYKIL